MSKGTHFWGTTLLYGVVYYLLEILIPKVKAELRTFQILVSFLFNLIDFIQCET